MARDYARIMSTIWGDPDFRALSCAAQRMYFVVLSQPKMSLCGVGDYFPRRLAVLSTDESVESVDDAIKELEHARYLIVDRDTDEVLIRSFVRNDGVLKSPNVAIGMAGAYRGIVSLHLRRAFILELRRLREDPVQGTAKGWSEKVTELLTEPFQDPDPNGSGKGLEKGPSDPSGKGCPTPLAFSPSPYPLTQQPGAAPNANLSPTLRAGADAPPTPSNVVAVPTTTQTLVAEWINNCSKRPPDDVIGQTAKKIKKLLDEKIDPADISAGIDRWQAKGMHPSALPSFVNEAMNANNQQRDKRPSTTDAAVQVGLDLAAKYHALDGTA